MRPRDRHRTIDRRHHSRERGAVLITVGLLLVPLMIMAALVIDLGTGYASGRQTQNAADLAALAATRQLGLVRYANGAAGTVDTTAHAVADANGADDSRVSCTVIRPDQSAIGTCTVAANVTDSQAAGVQITAGHKFSTSFANVIGVSSLTTDRTAAATIQSIKGQDSPIYACAFNQTDGQNPSPDLLLNTNGVYSTNPAAVGKSYFLHGPHVSNCGLGSQSWKGVAGPGPFTLPAWLPIATGVKAGPIRSQIAGLPGCGAANSIGCVLLIPICTTSNGGNGINGQLYCVEFGVFQLVSGNANSQVFMFVGAATATGGQGGTTLPGANDPRLVKLVQ